MPISREEAIQWLSDLHPGAIYVIGIALSRDVYEIADHPRNLYLVHGMGQALSVGIGLAQSLPDHSIVVIDGDGSAIMGAASWTLLHTVPNLTYYVLVNEVYETTGGQALILPEFEPENLFTVSIDRGKIQRPEHAPIRVLETDEGYLCPKRIKERFQNFLSIII
jgi:pyruvate/2-oxoacid:ferredoxin oxidoreductase beta subunit